MLGKVLDVLAFGDDIVTWRRYLISVVLSSTMSSDFHFDSHAWL